MAVTIRQALIADTQAVHGLLLDAARWVDALGVVMWEDGELEYDAVAADVRAGMVYLAEIDGLPAGMIRFQLADTLFWPELVTDDSAFVHRLVVSRAFKGRGVSSALLHWAADHARRLGKAWLRLDCDDDRPKLKALYERFGFRLHSHRQVGPYYVARYELELGS